MILTHTHSHFSKLPYTVGTTVITNLKNKLIWTICGVNTSTMANSKLPVMSLNVELEK